MEEITLEKHSTLEAEALINGLLECPRCQSDEVALQKSTVSQIDLRWIYWVKCRNCGIQTSNYTTKISQGFGLYINPIDAVQDWNTRF